MAQHDDCDDNSQYDERRPPRRQPAAKRHKARQQEASSMPAAVYPILWSFLLDSSSTSESSLIDFQSVASLMLVSRTSKKSFDACRGWWQCAQALKREAEAKMLLAYLYGERITQLERQVQQMPETGTFEYETLVSEICLLDEPRARMETPLMETVEKRIFLIQDELLPEVSRLVVGYGGDEVSMDSYYARQCLSLRALVLDIKVTKHDYVT